MNTRRILLFFLVILALSIFSILYPTLTGNATKQDYYPKEQAILTRAVDGDTIHALVNGKDQTIRLLGINTPEKNMPMYGEAKEFLKQFENKSIELERDNEDSDKYKRKLRYVFFNNQMLNIKILENGLANSYYTAGLKYEKEFLSAEQEAKTSELGVWKKSADSCAECIILVKLDSQNESFILRNICSFNCSLAGWFVKDAGRNTFYLDSLASDSTCKYSSKKETWNNDHDQFFIFDKEGFLVLYYSY